MLKCVNRLRILKSDPQFGNFLHYCTNIMTERHLAKGDPLPAVDRNKIRLYSMRFCPYVQRTKLVLEHKKIPHETVFVNLKRKPDWLFERNPYGLVPVLEFNGNIMYESTVCDEYLEEAYPGSSNGTRALMPSSPLERANMRLCMSKLDKMVDIFYRFLRDHDNRPAHFEKLMSRLQKLETHLTASDKPFFGGKEYGMADFHGWPWFERMAAITKMTGTDILPASQFPRVAAWVAAMQQLDVVKRVWLSPDMHAHFFETFMAGEPDYDAQLDAETLSMQRSAAPQSRM